MKRSMLRPYVIYVPEEIWMKFIREEVDHFEYDVAPGRSVAVYADGTREEFDSEVTPEREAAEREKWLADMRNRPDVIFIYEGTIEVPNPRHHYQIKKVTG